MTIDVAVLLFERTTLLTLTSILEALNAADRWSPDMNSRRYRVHVVSYAGGNIETWNGCSISTTSIRTLDEVKIDTLIISGGLGYHTALRNTDLINWIARRAAEARRVCALGGGLFLAAEAGLLRKARVALHPVIHEEFQTRYPDSITDHDALFSKSGDVWTSPGMAAAVDMTLALIEEDFGRYVALDVARFILVFMKREGGDRQLSSVLRSQAKSDRFEELHSWIVANLDQSLSVADLARHVGMSVRNFSRAYRKALGQTPSSFVRSLRVETAIRALTNTNDRISEIVYKCGFANEEQMRRSFIAAHGVPPSSFRTKGRLAAEASNRRGVFVSSLTAEAKYGRTNGVRHRHSQAPDRLDRGAKGERS